MAARQNSHCVSRHEAADHDAAAVMHIAYHGFADRILDPMYFEQRLRRDVAPRKGEGTLKRRLISDRKPHVGAASLAPSAGHRPEDIGLCLDKHGLLFWGQLYHAPVLVRIT